MHVELTNRTAKVVQATDDEHAWLHEYLSFEDQRTKFMRRRDGSVKVGPGRRVSLLQGMEFPAGLVGKVKRAAIQAGKLIKIVDKRRRPCTVLTWQQATGTADPWLYDFQREAVDAALTRTRGILDVPTGGGKTEIAVGLAMRLGMTNTLFIAPEADLMHNAARRWEKRTGVEAGRIGDGHLSPRDGFTAATFQTLARRMNDPKLKAYLPTVGAMIVDEVHTLPADSFYNVAQSVDAYWRVGVSGTPLARGDRRSLFSIAATGAVIYKVETQLLIDRGFISKPHIRMVTHEQAGDAASWQKGEKQNIVESRSRNALITRLARVAPKPGLVFVKLKKHGRVLTEMLNEAGIEAEFIWGEKNTAQRDAAIKRLQEGELDVIVCSVVFQTGTDIPEVRSMVIACGGKSEIATLQRIGRGMRVVRDEFTGNTIKDQFWVYDVMDMEPKRDAGHTGNRWNARHSRERFKAYTGVGHEVTIKEGVW
jgi:superfamily II DNA or RNA helicase